MIVNHINQVHDKHILTELFFNLLCRGVLISSLPSVPEDLLEASVPWRERFPGVLASSVCFVLETFLVIGIGRRVWPELLKGELSVGDVTLILNVRLGGACLSLVGAFSVIGCSLPIDVLECGLLFVPILRIFFIFRLPFRSLRVVRSISSSREPGVTLANFGRLRICPPILFKESRMLSLRFANSLFVADRPAGDESALHSLLDKSKLTLRISGILAVSKTSLSSGDSEPTESLHFKSRLRFWRGWKSLEESIVHVAGVVVCSMMSAVSANTGELTSPKSLKLFHRRHFRSFPALPCPDICSFHFAMAAP